MYISLCVCLAYINLMAYAAIIGVKFELVPTNRNEFGLGDFDQTEGTLWLKPD